MRTHLAGEKSLLGVLVWRRDHSKQPPPLPTAGMESELDGRVASQQWGPEGRRDLTRPDLHVRKQQWL